jgi:hypothetical protein
MKRTPKEKPPTFIDCKDIDKATMKNGTVDLAKVRRSREKRKREFISRSKRGAETRRRKREVAEHFQTMYQEFFEGTYKFRKKRFVSYKKKDSVKNEYVRKRLDSDVQRLWALYKKIEVDYGGGIEEYVAYLRHAFDKIMTEYEIDRPTKLVGMVIADKFVDEYFFERKRKALRGKKKNRVKNRASTHAKYFNGE